MKKWIIKHRRGISTAAWIIALFVVWEFVAFLLADVFHDSMAENKLPYVHDVAVRLVDNFGTIIVQAKITLVEIGGNILGIPGKIVGAAVGSAVGAVKGVFVAIFDR